MMVTPDQAKEAAALMRTGDAEQRHQAARIVSLWQAQQGTKKSKFPRNR